jgi:hypothetical protein
LLEESAQRDLANLAYAPGAQFEAIGGAIDETLIFESLEGTLEALHVASGVITQVPPHRFDVDFWETLGRVTLAQKLL